MFLSVSRKHQPPPLPRSCDYHAGNDHARSVTVITLALPTADYYRTGTTAPRWAVATLRFSFAFSCRHPTGDDYVTLAQSMMSPSFRPFGYGLKGVGNFKFQISTVSDVFVCRISYYDVIPYVSPTRNRFFLS